MANEVDLRELLASWPYDPNRDARVVRGADGREILQVRLPLGIEQYELDGRPDGARPQGKESLLDGQLERFAAAQSQGDAFKLGAEACAELSAEGTLYYLRYVRLFQLQDWKRTIRDTTRNLKLFDFIRQHAERGEDRQQMEKWRPYIVRMNAVARAMIALSASHHDQGLAIVRHAVRQIEALPELADDTFRYERDRSLVALRGLAAEIEKARPLSELQQLEKELKGAVMTENFEQAAALRDRIRGLRSKADPE